jgi:sugar phosphate isomerase/epimerase
MFRISAFGDEIADDLETQARTLRDLNIRFLDLRGAWGKNVLHLSDADVAEVKRICAKYDIAVSCIGSPIGKSPLQDPLQTELDNLDRIMQMAERLGTRYVRVFSFYPPDTRTNAQYDQHVAESAARLEQLTAAAQKQGFVLLLENEKEIVGDTVARCHALLQAVDSPALRFVWDPANFVQVGEEQVSERGWPLLGAYVAYVHVKDVVRGDGVRVAGQGDGQVPELLVKLYESGYDGMLALEPHLAVAGHSGGFSGVEGMTLAVQTLRQVMAANNCREA